MSLALPTTGKTKMYDHTGRTRIPKEIKDKMGFEKGDDVKWVLENGKLSVYNVSKEASED